MVREAYATGRIYAQLGGSRQRRALYGPETQLVDVPATIRVVVGSIPPWAIRGVRFCPSSLLWGQPWPRGKFLGKCAVDWQESAVSFRRDACPSRHNTAPWGNGSPLDS